MIKLKELLNEDLGDKMRDVMGKLAKSLGLKSIVSMHTGKGSLSYFLDDDREAKKLQKFLQRSFKRVRLIQLDKPKGDTANWVVAADMLGLESVNEDFWATPAPFSSQEAKLHLDMDIKKMSKHLGKASQQVIKIMMNGVKGNRYDALDIQRGLQHGPATRTHHGEAEFIQMLWRKVRDGFRRYSPDRKLKRK